MKFILGNHELEEFLCSDEDSLIPYMTNDINKAKIFERRLDALQYIEKFENMNFYCDHIKILKLHGNI